MTKTNKLHCLATNNPESVIRYIVTKASDNGTFEVGDHILINSDGSISCIEAQGWIDNCDVEEATKGIEIEIDHDWIERRKSKLRKELAELNYQRMNSHPPHGVLLKDWLGV
jgi:hypothetical protein